MTFDASEGIFYPHESFMQAAEQERAEVDVPSPVVHLFQCDVFADTGDGNVHPGTVPADSAVGADIAYLESVRVL